MRKFLALIAFFLCFQAFAQNRTVSGKVTDENGRPVSNASIAVKGTSIGTTSNENGNYSITIPSRASTLVVSYTGMGEKEIDLSSASNYDVSLSAKIKDLQEVVVVGYGTQKRANLTASISTIKAPDIENRPYTSVDQMLEGKVPGLQAPLSTGQPGANQQVIIRGIGSVSAGTSPLYVVDGLIINSGDLTSNTTTANALAGLNPNDVESVTILKDAQATSIYGSRGANGVREKNRNTDPAIGKNVIRRVRFVRPGRLKQPRALAQFHSEYALLLRRAFLVGLFPAIGIRQAVLHRPRFLLNPERVIAIAHDLRRKPLISDD